MFIAVSSGISPLRPRAHTTTQRARARLLAHALLLATMGCGVGFPFDYERATDHVRTLSTIQPVDASGTLRDSSAIAVTFWSTLAEVYYLAPGANELRYADLNYPDERRFWRSDAVVSGLAGASDGSAGAGRVYWASLGPTGGVRSVADGNQPGDLTQHVSVASDRVVVSFGMRTMAIRIRDGAGVALLLRLGTQQWRFAEDLVPLWAENAAASALAVRPNGEFVAVSSTDGVTPVTLPAGARVVRVDQDHPRPFAMIAFTTMSDETRFAMLDITSGTSTPLGTIKGSWRAPALWSRDSLAVVWTTQDGDPRWHLELLEKGTVRRLFTRAFGSPVQRPLETRLVNGFIVWSWSDGLLYARPVHDTQ